MSKLLGLAALSWVAFSCSVPDFEVQTPAAATLSACSDGKLSPGEADIDCGQVCATPCLSGKSCVADADCASAFCSIGVCTDQTCSDGLKNQDESDIDCGGNTGCAPCAPGKACLATSDCDQGACTDGKCRAASCDDGLKNNQESDVDCGGSCPPCASGQTCNTNSDCDLALCTAGKCRPQACTDGLENQDETDIDCGGTSGCARCTTGQHCATNADCDKAECSKATCQPTSCMDGVQNGSETGVDCGGSCAACGAGSGCMVAKDCTSGVCTPGTLLCAAPSCTDGVLNGSEPTVDCGASCPNGCQIADACATAKDCASGKCLDTHCVPQAPSNKRLPTTGWVATASSSEMGSTAPPYALDGDVNTHWTNGTPQLPGMWFEVDMAKPQVFFSITVVSTSVCCDYGRSMELSGSLDGKNFTVLRTNIAGQNTTTITFASPQYERFLMLKLLTASNGLWWRIDELNVLQ